MTAILLQLLRLAPEVLAIIKDIVAAVSKGDILAAGSVAMHAAAVQQTAIMKRAAKERLKS